MNTYAWYKKLKKPSWAPPQKLFGPVWTVLYILIVISFGKVFLMYFSGQVAFSVLLPFILNLIANFIFTPIQFGIKNNLLAALDIILVWLTLVWCMTVLVPICPWLVFMQVPYFTWVTTATILQLTITYLNR